MAVLPSLVNNDIAFTGLARETEYNKHICLKMVVPSSGQLERLHNKIMNLKFVDQNTRGEDIQLPITNVRLNCKDRDISGYGGKLLGPLL